MITLGEVDHTTGAYDFQVYESQKAYVASLEVMLGRAYIHRKLSGRAFWIMDDDRIVGMGLYYDCPEKESYDFD